MPEVHADYCFPRDHTGGEYAVVLVARDRETRMTVAHVVPLKGAEQEWVAEQVVRDLLNIGHHGALTLKTDQEPAIIDLMRSVAKLRGASRTALEQFPVGDSAGNGVAERAVQSIEKLLRTHKLALEGRLKTKISVKHPIFAWLVEHVADVFNRFAIGTDGKTAVQRLKGKPAEGYTHEFATHVMFRVVGKVDGGLDGGAMVHRTLAGEADGNGGAHRDEGGRVGGAGQGCAGGGQETYD